MPSVLAICSQLEAAQHQTERCHALHSHIYCIPSVLAIRSQLESAQHQTERYHALHSHIYCITSVLAICSQLEAAQHQTERYHASARQTQQAAATNGFGYEEDVGGYYDDDFLIN
jgi:multidrug resistance efflux pump